jgi:SAM-dependent methyltransferase
MPEPQYWADDEAFWEAMEPALCSSARLELAVADVTAIWQGLGLTGDEWLLDLACGPGAHAVAFAARGLRVTGVDRTERLLSRARRASAERALGVEWLQADMRTFRRSGHFDVVCSLYNSLAYFDDATNRRILENVRASLRPGGRVLIDLISRETVAAGWYDRQSLEVDGVSYSEVRSVAEDGAVLVSDWFVEHRSEAPRTFHIRQKLYSGAELGILLKEAGYSQVSLFGSLDCNCPFDETSRRLVAVADR